MSTKFYCHVINSTASGFFKISPQLGENHSVDMIFLLRINFILFLNRSSIIFGKRVALWQSGDHIVTLIHYPAQGTLTLVLLFTTDMSSAGCSSDSATVAAPKGRRKEHRYKSLSHQPDDEHS